MGQSALFVGAPEALTIGAHYEHGYGWVLTLRMRRQGQQWLEASREDYSHLTTPELMDVLDVAIPNIFTR